MSIFAETFAQYVKNQLDARKQIVSQQGLTGLVNGNPVYKTGVAPRVDNFLRYTTGKNSWVKMQSFVDFNGKIGSKSYTGSQLARKYILEGGTLFESKNDDGSNTNKFTLRSGVGRRDSIYASDIDVGGDRPFGYRPMPGITSVQVTNKSAYGSLREATIKFYAWDKHQLEELEVLYMRTGYSVLLEWGWSQYLDSKDLNNIQIKNFDTPTIDAFYDTKLFNESDTQSVSETLVGKLVTLSENTYGNYDGMLGYIKNFSWQLMDNGGFECTTVLISKGEVISTLKLNSNSTSFTDNQKNGPDTPPLSLFESIMLNYSVLISEGELLDTGGQFNTGSSAVTSATVSDLKNDILNKLKTVKLKDIYGYDYNDVMISDITNNGNWTEDQYQWGVFSVTTGNVDGISIEYIKLSHFIALINFYFNVKNNNNVLYSPIAIPSQTVCLRSKNSVSIDPTTCIIFNANGKVITGDTTDGVLPKTYIRTSGGIDYFIDSIYAVDSFQFPMIYDTFTDDDRLGDIGNIFVSIPKILQIYRSKGANNSDINIMDFLKELLNQISKALGGINDFRIHSGSSGNTNRIIDVKYLEKKSSRDNKYTLDLIGLKSICRDVKITSRIFENQSSMIAIAAQNKSNVGDIYSSTQTYFNKGLTDRLTGPKTIYNEPGASEFNKLKKIFGDLVTLRSYLARKCLGILDPSDGFYKIIYPEGEEISNAASLLRSFLLQLDDKLDFKAIIPIELEITLDGMSGIIVGEIFKIDTSILPDTYRKKNIGFIVTGIQHSLQNNDWTTNIKAQVCLLDADDPVKTKLVKDFEDNLGVFEAKREVNIIMWDALSDYMVFIADKFLKSIFSVSEYKTSSGWKQPIDPNNIDYKTAMIANSVNGAKVFDISKNEVYSKSLFNSPYKNADETTPNLYFVANTYPIDPFGYIVDPNFEAYFNNVWLPTSKTKYASDTAYMDKLNKVSSFSDLTSLAETEAGVKFNIPSGLLLPQMKRFLAFPVALQNKFGFTTAEKAITDHLRESFMLRNPTFISFIKDNCEQEAGYTYTPSFYPFNKGVDILFNKFSAAGVDDRYRYNKRTDLPNGNLKNAFYNYIIDSNVFSNLDPLFLPSYADISKTKSIYDPSQTTL